MSNQADVEKLRELLRRAAGYLQTANEIIRELGGDEEDFDAASDLIGECERAAAGTTDASTDDASDESDDGSRATPRAQRLAQALSAELEAESWGEIDPFWIACVAKGDLDDDNEQEILDTADLLDRTAARLGL